MHLTSAGVIAQGRAKGLSLNEIISSTDHSKEFFFTLVMIGKIRGIRKIVADDVRENICFSV